MPVKLVYGTYKDGGDIYKDGKGYYVIQWDVKKQKEYKKYIKGFKPKGEPFKWYMKK
jgi:hypothetical protein